MLPSLHFVANPHSGAEAYGALIDDLVARLGDQGFKVTLDKSGSVPLDERARRAASGPADIVVAAGGDGTITAVAAALLGTGKTLAVLPLGTANLLARDLGIPLEPEAWIDAFAEMQPRLVDVGTVNGRPFLHKVVIGFAPAIAAGRERLRGRQGIANKIALFGFMIRRFFRARRIALEFIRDDWEVRLARVQAIAVANNAYDEEFGHFFSRSSLDRGILSLYLVRHLRIRDAVRLAIRMMLGRWGDDEALTVDTAKSVTIRSRKQRVKAMIDGEVETLFTPVRFEIRPRALGILAPPVATEQVSSAPSLVEA